MEIDLIDQPFQSQIGNSISEILNDEQIDEFIAVVAWAKASGLRRIGADLDAARHRGVNVRIAVGVDQGGASLEGLKALQDLTSETHVFFNPKNPKRTFHPKFYLGLGSNTGIGIVGSGNMTSGGLYSNYEVATITKVHGGEDEDASGWAYLRKLEAYYNNIVLDDESARVLTDFLVTELSSDPRIILGRERNTYRPPGRGSTDSIDHRAFEESNVNLLSPPAPSIALPGIPDPVDDDSQNIISDGSEIIWEELPVISRDENAENESAPNSRTEAAPKRTDNRWTSFYKQLSRNDASLSGSPGQIIIPKRFTEFFGNLELELDGSGLVGSQQWSRHFHARLLDTNEIIDAPDARLAKYMPGTNHPRTNIEYRFTFRNREASLRLNVDDILIFEWDGDTLNVTRSSELPAVASGSPNRYAWLTPPN